MQLALFVLAVFFVLVSTGKVNKTAANIFHPVTSATGTVKFLALKNIALCTYLLMISKLIMTVS